MRRFKPLLLLLTVVLLTLSACATTMMTGTWENRENFRPAVDDVAVFIVPGRPELRRLAEQDLVEQLTRRQVRAVAGSTFYGGGPVLPIHVLWEQLQAEKIRFVLVTREFKRDGSLNRPRSIDVPADYLEFYEHFSNAAYEPLPQESFAAYQHVSLETNLYDVQSQQIVMSIISDSIKKGDLNEVIRSFCDEVLEHMAKKGYLPAS